MFAYCGNNPINFLDSEGRFAITAILIAGAVGGIASIASQLISDAVANDFNPSHKTSNWQTYAGAFIGGVAGGITTMYAGATAGNFVSSGVSTFATMFFENISGEENHSLNDIACYTLLDASLGMMAGEVINIKMPTITAGRNNMSAVYRSGLTKLRNEAVSKMSAKVIGKGLASTIISDIGISMADGLSNSMYKFILDSTPKIKRSGSTLRNSVYIN